MLFPPPKPPSQPHPVVVTGAGILTALGSGWRANAEGFRAGRVAIRPVSGFDVSRQRTKIAAEADLPAQLPHTGLTEKQERRLERAARMLLLATHEAWRRAGWTPSEDIPLVF